MLKPFPLPVRQLGGVTLMILAVGSLTACRHRPPPRGAFPGEMGADMPQVSLHASGTFFDGQLVAEATVTRGVQPRFKANSHKRKSSGDSDFGGKGGAMARMGGGDRDDGGMGGPGGGGPPRGGDMDGGMGGGGTRMGSSMGGGMPGPSGSGGPHFGNVPPLTLQVHFVNKGKNDLHITVRDVNSILGNFVPVPEKIVLAPGQATDLEAMTSRLGVVTAEIRLTLALRIGDKTESQVLVMRASPEAASEAVPTATEAGQ